MEISVVECNYSDAKQRLAITELINIYIADEMGGGELLSQKEESKLLEELERHPKSMVFLAQSGDSFCGMLVAFENFSTFKVRPMINIHDVIVKPEYRNKGVGRKLLEAVIQKGKSNNSCRITLEVRVDNMNAQHLYKSLGFEATDPDMYYWRNELH